MKNLFISLGSSTVLLLALTFSSTVTVYADQLALLNFNTANQFDDEFTPGTNTESDSFVQVESGGLGDSGAVSFSTTTPSLYVTNDSYELPASEGDILSVSAYFKYEEVDGCCDYDMVMGFLASSTADIISMPDLSVASLGIQMDDYDELYYVDEDSYVGDGLLYFPNMVPGEWYKIIFSLESTGVADTYNVHAQVWNSDEDGNLYSLRSWSNETDITNEALGLMTGDNGSVHAYIGATASVEYGGLTLFDNFEVNDDALPTLWAGAGTEGSPYQVDSCADLQAINGDPDTDEVRYFELTDDIDCAVTEDWNGGQGFIPIGMETKWGDFDGVFDGNYYTISNLYIDRPDDYYQGLFAETDAATIRNLVLSDFFVAGYEEVGALVGDAYDTTIERVGVEGAVIVAEYDAGGLVGSIDGDSSISSSYVKDSTITIIDNGSGGGLVGYLYGPTIITDSYAIADVAGEVDWVTLGGLVGYTYPDDGPAQIMNSYSQGSVTTTGNDATIGGFIGGGEYEITIYRSFSIAEPLVVGDDPFYAGAFSGKWGEDSGIAGNYYYSDTELSCNGNNETTDEECMAVESASYFYSMSNGPYPEWDIVLSENSEYNINDNLPVLSWEVLGEEGDVEWFIFDAEEEVEEDTRARSSSGGRAGGSNTNTNTSNSNSTLINQIIDEIKKRVQQMIDNGETVNPTILSFINNLGATNTTTSTDLDLEYGDEGGYVSNLQTLLINNGYSIPAGATGSFLEQTRTALTAFQTANNISPAAGYFGAATRAVMKSLNWTGLWW